jgi:hypothetical protein
MEINQPKKVKLEMRGNKLRSGVDWQGMLKQKNPKQGICLLEVKMVLVYPCFCVCELYRYGI